MKAENEEYLKTLEPEFERLLAMAGWDNVFRTGILKKFDAVKIRDIIREDFAPSFNTDLDDPGAVYQMILYAFRQYGRAVTSQEESISITYRAQ